MSLCAKCGSTFTCGAETPPDSTENKALKCWCLNLPQAQEIPAEFKSCLCQKCLKAYLPPEPDFYWENGLCIFTASYHLKRGHCCQNNCRHCPY